MRIELDVLFHDRNDFGYRNRPTVDHIPETVTEGFRAVEHVDVAPVCVSHTQSHSCRS